MWSGSTRTLDFLDSFTTRAIQADARDFVLCWFTAFMWDERQLLESAWVWDTESRSFRWLDSSLVFMHVNYEATIDQPIHMDRLDSIIRSLWGCGSESTNKDLGLESPWWSRSELFDHWMVEAEALFLWHFKADACWLNGSLWPSPHFFRGKEIWKWACGELKPFHQLCVGSTCHFFNYLYNLWSITTWPDPEFWFIPSYQAWYISVDLDYHGR